MIAAWVLAAFAQAGAAAVPSPHTLYQRGIEALDQGRWAEALPIYREITARNPVYGWGWMGLGWSLHYTGDCRAALPAYQRALELGGLPPYRVMQEMARCQAELGDPVAAVDLVRRALAAGYPMRERLRTDRALAPLHDRDDFRALFGPVTSPESAGRVDGWRADLELLEGEIRRIHYSAGKAFAPGELAASMADLRARAATSTDAQMTVGLMRLLRRLGDGHTYADPAFMQRATSVALPLQFERFEEGIFITATTPEHAALLWARVDRVDATAIAAVYDQLAAIVPQDNTWRPRAIVPEHLRFPQLLNGLGIAASTNAVTLAVRDRHGADRSVTVDVVSGPIATWLSVPEDDSRPLAAYVARRRDWYWFERMPQAGTMYVQYNACANKEDESVEAFAARLAAALDDAAIDRLVVDLRWNGGGNNFANLPLLETITRARQNAPGRLFVITGPHTFSAAMIFAAQLERYTHAIFAGEPTGSSPNFVGETTFVTLPHTGIAVSLSNLYWQTSHATDFRPWIPPMLYVPETFAAFRARRDIALETILAYPR